MIKAYKLLEGVKIEEFRNFMLELFEKKIKSRIYPQAIERINFHKQNGHETVLLSKSCKILIDIIKDYLDVSSIDCHGIRSKKWNFNWKN
jgi:phosphoserine phosphatase